MDNSKLWEERYKRHDGQLANHEERISSLETFEAGTKERMDSLIKNLENLTATMRWFMALLIGAFVGFFFYFVQSFI